MLQHRPVGLLQHVTFAIPSGRALSISRVKRVSEPVDIDNRVLVACPRMAKPVGRQLWLWVTGPDYYSSDGVDNPDLTPVSTVEWTCNKETRAGDLVMLYRTAPASDIAYLLEVSSDAFAIWDGDFEGSYACETVSRVKFARPLAISDMRADPELQEGFGPLRAQFRRRVYRIDQWWLRLRSLLIRQNPETEQTFQGLERSIISKDLLSEREIEDALEKRFASLDPGTGLKLYTGIAPNGTELSGRQYHCPGVGRIDLLGRDREGFVVVEIKRGFVDKSAIGQTLAYMGWIRERLADEKDRVRGILVGRDLNPQAQYALNVAPRLSVRFLDEFGL